MAAIMLLVLFVAATIRSVLALASFPGQQGVIRRTSVFNSSSASTDGKFYKSYRIPSLVQGAGGVVIAFAEGRVRIGQAIVGNST